MEGWRERERDGWVERWRNVLLGAVVSEHCGGDPESAGASRFSLPVPQQKEDATVKKKQRRADEVIQLRRK
jgi:hypothetical protein